MTKSKLTTRLVFETERTIIFRSRSRLQSVWCTGCGADVEMAIVEQVAREAGVSELAVYQLVEARALHFVEDEDGRVLICRRSFAEVGRA
jgi:hypothetical protein